ncbi:MAG: DNA repair protein RadA [Parcubacteria group bacterium]|nr:DNA repair protein RadA [Parcubacteria group bacterium]
MSKPAPFYSCSHCGAQALKWSGRCLECGKWGTLVSDAEPDSERPGFHSQDKKEIERKAVIPSPLSDIKWQQEPRLVTGISEFDNVLGGGIVAGSLVLLGGDPGIGKSTLALQVLQAAFKSEAKDGAARPLYISGEESGQQITLRADRLGIHRDKIDFLGLTEVETIAATIAKHKPPLVVIDSIQTIYSTQAETEPGSVTQVRACTIMLLEAAKTSGVPVILIGHVTKDGLVAGPKTLEHLVDTVLYLEGDRFHAFRILRTVKNRFGATNEVGLFSMEEKGLLPVENPSALFVTSAAPLPGSVITCVFEGSRPFLVEIQALVTKSSYASPQRRASGYDSNRLQLLLAVLNERTDYDFSTLDVHLNIVGGLKIHDPGTDLAVCAALASALANRPVGERTIILGEVGLAGEVRPVRQGSERLKEAAKLGYEHALIPEQKTKVAMEITTVRKISDLKF